MPPYPENYFSDEAAAIATRFVAECVEAKRQGVTLPGFPEDEMTRLVDNTWGDTGKAILNNWLGLVYELTNLDRKSQFMSGVDPDDPLQIKAAADGR